MLYKTMINATCSSCPTMPPNSVAAMSSQSKAPPYIVLELHADRQAQHKQLRAYKAARYRIREMLHSVTFI